jgi:hypothetical protein
MTYSFAKLIVAIIVVIGLAFVIAEYVEVQPTEATHSIDLSSQAEGAWQLPPSEVRATIEAARTAMFRLNGTATTFKTVGTIATWASFACSALIAIVLGWRGRIVSVAQDISSDSLVGLSRTAAGVIGVLAALATIGTVGGSRAQAQAEVKFSQANALNTQISETLRVLNTGADSQRQREALDQLKMLAERS